MNTQLCIRWREARHSWRHTSEGGFNRLRYDVAVADHALPRAFVETHHYSGSWPSTSHCYALMEHTELVGVATLTCPVRKEVLTDVFPGLEPYRESYELGRFVLLGRVPANAESWFLARVWELAAREGVRGVVSFSDPMPRTRLDDGTLVMPGHIGIVYQASNASYHDRATAGPLLLLPDGTALNRRALQKVRKQEQGARGVERLLVRWGAQPRQDGQDPRAWLRGAVRAARVRRIAHPGNYRYAFRPGTKAQRRAVVIAMPEHPYPKHLEKAA